LRDWIRVLSLKYGLPKKKKLEIKLVRYSETVRMATCPSEIRLEDSMENGEREIKEVQRSQGGTAGGGLDLPTLILIEDLSLLVRKMNQILLPIITLDNLDSPTNQSRIK
jgi:hypothetical protein